jgi:hypothetical protein
MMKARNRPPRLESRTPEVHRAPPATPEQLLERAKVTGRAGGPGPTEIRRFVERIVAGERAALGEVLPIPGLTGVDAWAAFTEVFGATPEKPMIDGARTFAALHRAVARVNAIGDAGGRVAVATGAPASLLPLHLAFARIARAAGADVPDLPDVGPLRIDGRTPRFLRWVDGVATVSDGRAICATADGEAARELLFVLPRPALVVGDGPFAEVAWEAGVEVVAFAGLDRGALAVAAARRERCTLVPLRTDRAPRAYASLLRALESCESRTSPPRM